MYDYFKEQSAGISKKAEGDRAQLNKILEINRKMRQYDLKRIKDSEVEELNINVSKMKDNWSDLKSFLQKRIDIIADVKERHEDDAEQYMKFVDYLEPKSLREKIKGTMDMMRTETERLQRPVKRLIKEKEYLEGECKELDIEIRELEEENRRLKDEIDLPQD